MKILFPPKVEKPLKKWFLGFDFANVPCEKGTFGADVTLPNSLSNASICQKSGEEPYYTASVVKEEVLP